MKLSILLLFALLLNTWKVAAQTQVKVTYEVTSLEPGLFDFIKTNMVVLFDDSLVYSYIVNDKQDPMKRRTEAFGDFFINHATYQRRGDSMYYHTTLNNNRRTTSDSSKAKLVSHTYKPYQWTFYSLGKRIYGYDTNTAVNFHTNDNGVSDTTIVWYAPALQSWKNVMGQYSGINGFPLEIQQQIPDRKITLVKIEHGNFKVAFPKSVEVISHEEFHKKYHAMQKKPEESRNKKGRPKAASSSENVIYLKYR